MLGDRGNALSSEDRGNTLSSEVCWGTEGTLLVVRCVGGQRERS